MVPAVCTRSGQIVGRIAAFPIRDSRCPLCGATVREPTVAEWPRPDLRVLVNRPASRRDRP